MFAFLLALSLLLRLSGWVFIRKFALHYKFSAMGKLLRLYHLSYFSDHMEGLYYCIVQQLEDFGYEKRVISEDVTVKLSVKVHYEAPQILRSEPTGKYELENGEGLIAFVEVSPDPELTYSWRHKGKLLEGFTSNVLRISGVNENCAGTYECRVKNKFGESSAEFELVVNEKRPQPSEKKALIITNISYDKKFSRLQTPHNDAEALKKCLSEYDFDCIHFQDLAAKDMRKTILNFFKGVKEGAYGNIIPFFKYFIYVWIH